MLRPDYQEFAALARSATLVPVVKSVSADLLTPVSAFLAIAGREPYAFLLESAEGGEKIGRYTFLGVRPYQRMQAAGDEIEIWAGGRLEKRRGHPIACLRELLGRHKVPEVAGLPPFTAGAVGFFAYDAVRRLEHIPERARRDLEFPDCALMFFDRLLAFDHLRHQVHIMAAADVERESPRRAYQRALADIERMERRLLAGASRRGRRGRPRAGARAPRLTATSSRQSFLGAVERVKEYIAAGDAYQVVLSQRLEVEPVADAFSVYRALRALNPSPYMYFLRMGDRVVLGSSPEMLVKVRGREIRYRPIAGTRPRGRDDAEDRRLEQELRNDEKERAEHVMLVDLGRNDLGRVSEYGSVQVRDLMMVERYSHVMHLVSALEGRLRPEVDALAAFAACFPAGTLTGAPKVRAMQIIEELEPVRRAIYGGAVLYADFAGNLDSCIAIRTLLLQGRKGWLQAGAGIVADSDPEAEYKECQNKAQAMVNAIQQAAGG